MNPKVNQWVKILFALVAVGLVFLVWFGLKKIFVKPAPIDVATTTPRTNNGNISVTKTDVAQNGGSKLPQGFPASIPVENLTIKDSYKAVYSNLSVTAYTVSYTSQKSRDDLWTTYDNYMNSTGYVIDRDSSKSAGQISGTKDNNTLSVFVSAHNGISLVQISYVSR